MERRSNEKKRVFVLKRKSPADWGKNDRSRLSAGFFGTLFSRMLPGVAGRMKLKMKIASLWENFALNKWLSCFLDRFLKTRVRATAVGILCFGFLCAAFTLFRLFSREIVPTAAVTQLALSLAVVVGALPLMLSRSLWHEALSTSLFASVWIHGLVSYRRDELDRKGEYPQGGRFSLFAGVVLGLLSWIVSPLRIAAGVLLLILLLQILYKPEFGLSLIALLFSFLGPETLLCLSLAVLVAFLFKLIRGKRVVRVEPADIFALFLFLLWASGIPFGLSRWPVVCLGAVIYFLFSKMVKTVEQAKRIFSIFVWELFFFGALFFAGKLFDWNLTPWIHRFSQWFSIEEMGYQVPLEIVMMLLPVAAAAVLNNGAMKLFRFAGLAMGLCTLLFSQSPGAIFCLAVSLVVLALLLGKRMIPVYIGLAVVAAAVFLFSPDTFYQLFRDVPALLSNTWNEQTEVIGTVFSRDWFQVLFGAWRREPADLNFWGDFLYRFGVVGCLVFGAVLVFFYRKCAAAFVFAGREASSRLVLGLLLSAGVLLLRGVTAGFTDHASVFGCFWLMCGLLCAVGDIAANDPGRGKSEGGTLQ